MKITAGMGTIDDYERYVEAGADELFAGYVPQELRDSEGMIYAANRREVFYYNVQLGSRSELEILKKMVDVYQKPVTITLNSLVYGERQYPKLLAVMEECCSLGFDTFIIADPVLLLWLKQNVESTESKYKIHLSGECGEINAASIQEYQGLDISRVIFHRKNTIADMKQMIGKGKNLEYEAFVLNELCQYNGSFCNSIHCDELIPACRLPYRLQKSEEIISLNRIDEMYETEEEEYMPGRSGCGLCALWKLRDAKVEYLKLVGRGNYSEDMVRDIKALRRALEILESSETEEKYQMRMKEELFPKGCSNRCYYLSD